MIALRQCCDTWRMASYWAKTKDRPVLEVICECVRKQIEYEQSPHCSYCGSPDVFTSEGTYSTGVVAPDGGHEKAYDYWQQCRRCDNRESI